MCGRLLLRESRGAGHPTLAWGDYCVEIAGGLHGFYCNPMSEGRKAEARSCTANELAVAPRASWFAPCFWNVDGRLFVSGTGGASGTLQSLKMVESTRRDSSSFTTWPLWG